MRFVILGAGAVGGYFGGRLAKAGEGVFLLARGAHLAAIRERGLRVEGEFDVRVPASDRTEDAGPADVLFVCVKAYDTAAAVRGCRAETVVTLQNGLGNLEALNAIFGRERVIGGVARVGAEVCAPGVIRHVAGGHVILGEQDGRITPRLARIKAAFDRAGVGCELTADLAQAIWEKLVANAVFNVIGAAHGWALGELRTGEKRALVERAIAELLAVARAKGIAVRPSAVDDCWAYCDHHPDFPTSTQQDVDRGKPTEWQALSGALVEEARRAGVPAPTHEALCARLRARTGESRITNHESRGP